jgi:small subunit ribosomal protein S1
MGTELRCMINTLLATSRYELSAVVPDEDGVIRARWRTAPSPSDTIHFRLSQFQEGEDVRGVVREVADYGVFISVNGDIEGIEAYAKLSRKKYRPIAARNDDSKVFSGRR